MALIQALRETALVLDTDVFSQWRNQQPNIKKAIADYQSYHKVLSSLTSMTVFETLSGIEAEAVKLITEQQAVQGYRMIAERFIQNCVVLPFDQNSAAIAAYIFPRLSQADRNKHWRDVFIAATVLAHRCGGATGNRKDFELIANHLPPGQRLHLAVWKP
jgi:predicted nucleic acid-binding protein